VNVKFNITNTIWQIYQSSLEIYRLS